MIIIDAHSHLWLRQDAVVDGQHIEALPNGRARFFGEIHFDPFIRSTFR